MGGTALPDAAAADAPASPTRRKKSKNKRSDTPGPGPTHVERGFHVPIVPRADDSDATISGASTPTTIGPTTATASPALRPSTPSGISALRLQLHALSLEKSLCSSPLNAPLLSRPASLQRMVSASAASEAASDSDYTEMDSYEIPLTHNFTDAERSQAISGYATPVNGRSRAVNKVVSADEFTPIRCLGKGSFGTVILVKQKTTGRLFAQKQLKKASLIVKKRLVEQTKTERQILKSVRHPFIVKLYYAFQDHEKLYLMLEYAQGGELFHHLSLEGMFTEATARFYMAEIVLALNHLQRVAGVIFRDLKPENCLLDAEGHLLLTDFGLSKVPVDDNDRCTSITGTIEFMAPEVVKGDEYGMAVDWWSLGAVSHDLLTGHPPFTGANDAAIRKKIVSHSKLHLPLYLGPDVKDLLLRLLRKDPKKRLGANVVKDVPIIKAHRFFRKIDWVKLEARQLEPPIIPFITDPELAENFSTDFTQCTLSSLDKSKPIDIDGPYDSDVGDDPFGGFSFMASSLLESDFFGDD